MWMCDWRKWWNRKWKPSSTGSTLSSTSQRDRVKRLIPNMRWGSLRQLPRRKTLHDAPIKCHNIFKALPEQQGHIRVVLTNGVCWRWKKPSQCRSFTLDLAEGSENQRCPVWWFLLSFRELNLIGDEQYSPSNAAPCFFIQHYRRSQQRSSLSCKVLFIFDGLDESRLSLDFHNKKKVVSDVHPESHQSNVLLTKPHPGESASLSSRLDNFPTCSSQSDPSCMCWQGNRSTRLHWRPEGGVLQEES